MSVYHRILLKTGGKKVLRNLFENTTFCAVHIIVITLDSDGFKEREVTLFYNGWHNTGRNNIT